MPKPGTRFSGSVGRTLEESAAGVPHGTIRWATAGQIRANGGGVIYEPELSQPFGMINRQHVHVEEGGIASTFGPPETNPVPKRKRFGGPEYVEPVPFQ